MEAPPRTGSYYFNYKKRHSIVLIAVVNSNYQFNMVDRSDAGPQSHGRVFSASNIAGALDEGLLNIPRCHTTIGAYSVKINYFRLFWSVMKATTLLK